MRRCRRPRRRRSNAAGSAGRVRPAEMGVSAPQSSARRRLGVRLRCGRPRGRVMNEANQLLLKIRKASAMIGRDLANRIVMQLMLDEAAANRLMACGADAAEGKSGGDDNPYRGPSVFGVLAGIRTTSERRAPHTSPRRCLPVGAPGSSLADWHRTRQPWRVAARAQRRASQAQPSPSRSRRCTSFCRPPQAQ